MSSEEQILREKLQDREWRLNNLYYIKNKQGKKVLFKMNWAQMRLYENRWYYNVILKARQLGMTTFIMIYFLDACLFNSNHNAGVIAHTEKDAIKLFDEKIQYAYDNLPYWLRKLRPADQANARTMKFSNGSMITVGTSLRSGTFQKLLVSELGKLSAKFPERAKEVKTGALNTVEEGQQIWIESTAEGKTGLFYDICTTAKKLLEAGKQLTKLEPRLHFFSWFDDPGYCLDDEQTALTVITSDMEDYFKDYPHLTAGQKAWYANKKKTQGDDMTQEYPGTFDEAFEGSMKGAFYKEEMRTLRRGGRITDVPYDRQYQVHTFWDLGQTRDLMTIWFYQYIENQHLFIDYHESNGQGWDFYANLLKEKGYNYGTHYFPHDGKKRIMGEQVFTTVQIAEQVGINPILVVGRTNSVWGDIQNHCKPLLPMCWFDEKNCAKGLEHLDNYKRKWDKTNSMYLQDHEHNEASHGADGWRTFAMARNKGLLASQYDDDMDDFAEDFDYGPDRNDISGY